MVKKILITLGGGGFLWESLRLIDVLGQSYEYHFVTEYDNMLPESTRLPPGLVYRMHSVATRARSTYLHRLQGIFVSLSDAWRIVRTADPDVVVGVGSSSAVPLLLCGRLLRRKTVFIESVTRFDHLSTTGRLILWLHLADRFYVQWPQLQRLVPKANYAGTVL